MWAKVAKSRKQAWLTAAGLSGTELRPVRQAIIDALLAHRRQHDTSDEASQPRTKKRFLLQIVDEAAPEPLRPALEFPGAVELEGLGGPPGAALGIGAAAATQAAPSAGPAATRTAADSSTPVRGRECDAATVPTGAVLIVGPTGSGKHRLMQRWARALSVAPPVAPVWDPSAAIVSQFGSSGATCTCRSTGAVPPPKPCPNCSRSFDEARKWLGAVRCHGCFPKDGFSRKSVLRWGCPPFRAGACRTTYCRPAKPTGRLSPASCSTLPRRARSCCYVTSRPCWIR